jgi:hypothetical protein
LKAAWAGRFLGGTRSTHGDTPYLVTDTGGY